MTAELSAEDLYKLVGQLQTLPGGPNAAITDFFAPHLEEGWLPMASNQAGGMDLEGWPLKAGGRLCLRSDPHAPRLRLIQVSEQVDSDTAEIRFADFPESVLSIAREHAVSPLVLALLCVATGQVDDGRRLKKALPKIDGAAKDLMLMTVCRLCG